MPREKALTKGDVFLTLLNFSLPFLGSNLLQALYGASDLFMVGRFSDSAGVSAVATGGQVMQTLTGLAIGLTTGGTVMIAKHFGARRRAEMADTVATSLGVFGVLSLFMTAATIMMINPICALLQVPPEALALTRRYLFICANGILFIVGFNAVSGILRGLGDSRTPLYFMVIACLINVSTDLLFVGVFKMGAPGAAISTVLAQAASLLLAFLHLFRKGYLGKYRASHPMPRIRCAHDILGVGVPIAMQDGLVNISFLIITALVNRMGLTASAAVGVVEKLIVFSMLPTTAFASAVAAMVAQNQGAGLHKRARKCLSTGIGLSLLFGVACFICAQVNAAGLVGIFTTDPAVIQAGAQYLRSYSADVIIVCFVFCMNTYFSGSGNTVFPLLHSLIATFFIRIPLSWILSRPGSGSMFALGFAAPLASALSLALCVCYLRRLKREENKNAVLRIKENCRVNGKSALW